MSSKKEKANRELAEEKLKAKRDAYFKEAEAYKKRVKPLVKFLRQNNLKFINAHVGQERVEYFRLDQFEKLVEEKSQIVKQNEELSKLAKNAYDQFIFFKRPDTIKIKYPKTLEPVLPTHPEKKYASFRFDTTESKRTMTILVIALVLVVVLFPIWPYHVKYGLWLLSLVLLILLVGIIVIRLVLFNVCVIFNYHIWLFPNFFYSTGIFDGFIPVIDISKGDRTWLNLFVRLFCISLFMLLSLHIYLNPTFLDETIGSTKVTINDIHDWGVGKIKNQGNFSQRALTNLDQILNITAHDDNIQHQKTEEEKYNEQHQESSQAEAQEETNVNQEGKDQGQNRQKEQKEDIDLSTKRSQEL